ncbi:hypothetical protein DL96DRAFT_1631459 [Flagelloscypha sp. PMI_526]|nr:hypothetical protein DL96DRAFT_1631459 [Flagelloscypha sp. PMI_526]
MDTLQSLGNQLSQITMYDVKSMYEQAKNVVLNVSENEAKIREATNDDPWGASSTLMQDIANRTFNYADFNEIMPSIYSRFMEKEARQWRQIYKSLQLLEYLIKNGSERVVDDARSHVSTVKMLRNFHHIDDAGKDQGLNVRNRAKEIVELLSDVEKIRSERRKAKSNKHKYTGTGHDGGFGGGYSGGFSSGGGSRYGGFGSDSFNDHYSGGGSSSNYGSGGGGSSGGFSDSRTSNQYEEYDAGGDDLGGSPKKAKPVARMSGSTTAASKKKEEPPKPKEPEVDLLGGFDDPVPAPVVAPPAAAATSKFGGLDDDFDDFQEAPVSPVPGNAAQAPAAASNPNAALMNLFNSTSTPMQPQTTSPPPMNYGGMGMGMGMGMQQSQQPMTMGGMQQQQQHRTNPSLSSGMGMGMGMGGVMAPVAARAQTLPTAAAAKKPTAAGGFDDLFSMALGSSSSKPGTPSGTTKSMSEMQKEKANAGLWGATSAPSKGGFNPNMMGNSGGFGNFGNSSSSGGDSLL